MSSSYTLGTHYELFINSLVESGRYASPSEVVRDSLRLMEEREKMREAKLAVLRRDIAEGLDSGPAEPLDMDAVKMDARQRRNASRHGA
jgi:antitoxin ParD1/3/4